MKKNVFLLLLLLISCKTTRENTINHFQGYWEIESVYKNGKLIKKYSINQNIDYFKIYSDSSGFRKKLRADLSGKFTTSNSVIYFKILEQNKSLYIDYKNSNLKEKIIKASKNMLILRNDTGLEYRYKSFNRIQIDL
tara:strand:- start:131 stop:541 length:411 start_codon:yes stop_codon:yes gene_type:complete